MKPLAAVREAERELAAAGVPEPRTDAELLVGFVLGLRRSSLYASDADLDREAAERLGALVARRRAREPLQHILGDWGFRRLSLTVDGRALVPRPETEVVVERCLVRLRTLSEPDVLDVGTGSGAIALALADEHPGARVTGVDSSAEALELAAENARRTGLADRVRLVHGDLFSEVVGPFDLVVSNPPYVAEEDFRSLAPEVREHEPRGALVAPGLVEALARGAVDVLRAGGWLVLESGDGQAAGVATLLRSLAYEEVASTPDLAGTPRVVEGRRPG